MVDKLYKYTVKCDVCDKSETYEVPAEDFFPDAWFELRNNGSEVPLRDEFAHKTMMAVKPIHFCLECFDRLFGVNGEMWKRENDDEDDVIGLTD